MPRWRWVLVPPGRLELPLRCRKQILSLPRLPIPPQGPRAARTGRLHIHLLYYRLGLFLTHVLYDFRALHV